MHNEVSRSRVHGHVVQAHKIGELHLHGNEVTHPPLTSWQNRPDLTPELEDLLHVQRDAAETLPYRLLGVKQPELTRVYVQQSVRAQADAEGKPSERPVPISEALATDHHLLITGEPGAGKSTLGQMYVQRLADEWLEPGTDPPLPEPVMPLRIPAKALAEDAPWSELLAKAVRNRHLNAPLRSELFARRALGARWLVFVDGLDEIAEPDRRRRVIEALAGRIRRGTDFRLVITTRPLPPDELQKLHGPKVDLFTIQPFGPVELKHFADGWFRAQNPLHAKERAEAFVRQVHDGRLRELVRNPLLVTIAAIANTLEPDRRLPHNRADLYERFMSYLLDDKPSGRTTLAELRTAHADDPKRAEQVELLYSRRADLVEHLAAQRLESEQSLLITASRWADTLVSEEDLVAVLASTGVFVHGDGGLRFLHHSFAEFLAARLRARSIPANFPDLDDWVRLGTQTAHEAYVLFTFALWGRQNRHDLGPLVARLLEGGVSHALLAGRLLAEDVVISFTRGDQVVDRLVKLVLANGVQDVPWHDAREIGRVLAGLDNPAVSGLLIPRLKALRDNTDLPQVVRICCAVALGHLDSPQAAAHWLRYNADVRYRDALSAISIGLAEILPNGADLAEELLLRLVETTNSYPVRLAVTDILLFDIDRREAARRLLRDLVRRMRATPWRRPTSLLTDTTPRHWVHLVNLLVAASCMDEAVWAAEQALAQSFVESDVFRTAVEVLLAQCGETALASVEARAWELTLEHVLIVAENTNVTLDLDWSVANDPAASDGQFVRACRSLSDFEPEEMEALINRRTSLGPHDLMKLANTLSKDRDLCLKLARRALHGHVEDRYAFGHVVSGALSLGLTGQEVHAVAARRSPVQRAVAAALLSRFGFTDLSADLVNSLTTDPLNAGAAALCLNDMVGKEIPEHAQRLFDELMKVARHNNLKVARDLTSILHRTGRVDEAVELAVDTFLRSLGTDEVLDCVRRVLDVSGATHADLVVAKVRELRLSGRERMAIANLFVSEGLLDHAVMMWLDAVRDDTEVIDNSMGAAAKLVEVGERAQAIRTVRTVLDRDPFASTARRNMRALLAWLEA